MIGKLLAGHYQILEVLGAGGFGETYIALDTHRPGNPECVVKHLKPADNDAYVLETARKLFKKEAETLESLGYHDQIPRLLAYFEEKQEFYLVQEFIKGHPLSKELEYGTKWTESQVVEMLQQALGILEFVHSQGVIHRDIKPDNIIRRGSDRKLVLIDFGAIKQVRTQTMIATGLPSMTVAIGTPGYMPTEQGIGAPRPNSDIYALGMIGIQALTGVYPHALPIDENTGEILWENLAVTNRGLIVLLNKMTRYHFKDRYQTATEALQAVKELANPASYPPTVPFKRNLPLQPSYSRQNTTPIAPAISSPVIPAPAKPKRSKLLLLIMLGIASAATGMAAFALFKTDNFLGLNLGKNLISQSAQECRFVSPTSGRDYAKLRTQPQRELEAVKQINKGEKVIFLQSQGDFAEIKLTDGSQGWVFEDQIQPCDATISTNQTSTSPPNSNKTPQKPIPEKPIPSPNSNDSDTTANTTASSLRGFKDGSAHGYKIGRDDGAANNGQGAMHLAATCSKESTGDVVYDQNYLKSCQKNYKQAFAIARKEILEKEQTQEKPEEPVLNPDKPEETPLCESTPNAVGCEETKKEEPEPSQEPTIQPTVEPDSSTKPGI